ncbi:PulJ/GspJ family protein [Bdellovibrio bacteriovorus]|nr:hypothetical protein [Bdellovibrio bacteriovorus]
MLNNRGIALVQVLVALGMSAIVGVIAMTLSDNMNKAQVLAERRAEQLEVKNFIIRHFADQANCNATIIRSAGGSFALDSYNTGSIAQQPVGLIGTTGGPISEYLADSSKTIQGCPPSTKPYAACRYKTAEYGRIGNISTGNFEFKYDRTTPGWQAADAQFFTDFTVAGKKWEKKHNMKLWIKVNSSGIIESCSGNDAVNYQLVAKTICTQFKVNGQVGVYDATTDSCDLKAPTQAAASSSAAPSPSTYTVQALPGHSSGSKTFTCANGVSSYSLRYGKCYHNMAQSATSSAQTGSPAKCNIVGNDVKCTSPGCNQGTALSVEGTITCNL